MTENIAPYPANPLERIERTEEVARARGAIAQLHNMLGAGYTVSSADQYAAAAEDLTRIKGIYRKLEDLRTGYVAPLNLEVKGINGLFKGYTDQLDTLETAIKRAIAEYTAAERARIAREQAAADQKAREARERAAARAEQLEAEGKVERAEQQRAVAATTAAPVMQPRVSTAKGLGVSVRQVWKFRIRDESKIPRQFLKVDEAKIGSYVRAMKDSAQIDGVEIYPDDQVAGRAAP